MKSIYTSIYCVGLCLLATTTVKAQTFFEGSRGQTSINLPIGGIARVNTTASSLKIGYYYNRSDKDVVFGIDASGISNNGIAPLTSGEKLSPEAHLNFNVGLKNIATNDATLSGYDYLNIKAGIGAARYKLIDVDAPFEQQISSSSFTKLNIGISYNYFLHGNMIFGAYGGYNRTNNIPNLNSVTVREKKTIGNSINGTERSVAMEYTAWQGHLKSINQFSAFLDYVYIPDLLRNRIALSAYSRSYFNSIRDITNAGVGIYLNRKDNPLKIVGGLIYEFSDLFNARNTGTSLDDRGTLGIVVGYNF